VRIPSSSREVKTWKILEPLYSELAGDIILQNLFILAAAKDFCLRKSKVAVNFLAVRGAVDKPAFWAALVIHRRPECKIFTKINSFLS